MHCDRAQVARSEQRLSMLSCAALYAIALLALTGLLSRSEARAQDYPVYLLSVERMEVSAFRDGFDDPNKPCIYYTERNLNFGDDEFAFYIDKNFPKIEVQWVPGLDNRPENCDNVVRPRLYLKGHFMPTFVMQAPGDDEVPPDFFVFEGTKLHMQMNNCWEDPCVWEDLTALSVGDGWFEAGSDFQEKAADFELETGNGGVYKGHMSIKFRFERVQ